MSGYPLVRFVSAPSPAATVRFDFQAAPGQVNTDGFSLGTPTLEGTKYGPREITVPIQFAGAKSTALPVMSAMARELTRRENWLQVQMSAGTDPVWFRTFQTAPGDVDFDLVRNDDLKRDVWQLSVTLPAEGCSYGDRVTLPAVTVNNDPAAGSNPCQYLLPDILGDAPTDLGVRLDPSIQLDYPSPLLMMLPDESRILIQSAAMVDGVGGSSVDLADTANAAYSGGSHRRITFATVNTLTLPSLWFDLPVMLAARYKMLVRVARSDTTSKFLIRGKVDGAWGETVRFDRAAMATAAVWIDLGEFGIPAGGDPRPLPGVPLTEPSVAYLAASREDPGTGNLQVDCVLFVPVDTADGQATSLRYDSKLPASSYTRVIVDGDNERVASASINALYGYHGGLTGGFPVAVPGRVNVLHLLWSTRPGDPDTVGVPLAHSDDIATTTTVIVTYHPRYLFLGSA